MVLSDTGDVAEGARWSLLCVARYVRFFSHFLRSVVNSLAQVALRWIELGLTTEASNVEQTYSVQRPQYGYLGKLQQLRRSEFPQLESKVYVDHAGATVYSSSQIAAVKQDLDSHLFGNPHSQHGWSGNEGSATAVAEARQLTLQMCNAPVGEYECVFTSGATGALKLIGEAFPWQADSQFVYTRDNHNSVLGIRQLALNQGAAAQCVEMQPQASGNIGFIAVNDLMQRQAHATHCKSCSGIASAAFPQTGGPSGPSLVAFPLESNFSGQRYPQTVVQQVQKGGLQLQYEDSRTNRSLLHSHLLSAAALQHGTPIHSQASDSQQSDSTREFGVESLQNLAWGSLSTAQQQDMLLHEQNVQHQSSGYPDQHVRQQQHLDSGQNEATGCGRWHVLIDAAKACATCPPDLTKHPADFVALSYYKIFGYPTGLGALLVRKHLVPMLLKQKSYFGGGTTAVSVAEEDFFRRREGAAGLEDGTAHYLGIAAVRHGFKQIHSLGGFPAVAAHTQEVTRWFATQLAAVRHPNAAPLCILYPPQPYSHVAQTRCTEQHSQLPSQTPSSQPVHNQSTQQQSQLPGQRQASLYQQGPVVTFNVLKLDGSYFGYREVENLAGLHGIYLRTGCFCNPGACAKHLGLTPAQLKANYSAGHVCWDDHDLIDGRPTGAVRVSFGWMSNLQDAQAVLTFLQTCFLGKAGDSLSCAGDSLSPADNIASDLGHKPTSCSIHQEDGVEVGASHARATDAAGSSTDATSDSESSIELESVGVAHQHLQRCQHVLPDQHLQQPQQHEQQQQRQQPNQGPFYQHTSDTAWRSSHHHQHQQPQHDQQPQHGQQPQHDQQTQHGQQVHHSLQMQTQHAQQSGHQGFESLKGLPWVSCGDAVRALTAAELQTQRQNPNSQASTSAATGKAGLVIDGSIPEPAQGSLQGIWVYPIKSCAGVQVESWPLGPNGLLHDREWALVGDDGRVFSQKTLPQLALVKPSIDLQRGLMQVSAPSMGQDLIVPLPSIVADTNQQPSGKLSAGSGQPTTMQVQICADSVCSLQEVTTGVNGDTAQAWFQQALGVRCSLIRQQPGSRMSISSASPRKADAKAAPQQYIGFANEGQFLLMNSASLEDLYQRMALQAKQAEHAEQARQPHNGHHTAQSAAALSRFRPNLLVGGQNMAAYAEDDWQEVQIGGTHMFHSTGRCARCEMICMDQTTAKRDGPEPLRTLAMYRRQRGRVYLGMLLGLKTQALPV